MQMKSTLRRGGEMEEGREDGGREGRREEMEERR